METIKKNFILNSFFVFLFLLTNVLFAKEYNVLDFDVEGASLRNIKLIGSFKLK